MSLAWFCYYSYKLYIMRGSIHDQLSHQFIEGPLQSKSADNSLQEVAAEKTALRTDQAQNNGVYGDGSDIDISHYEKNERHAKAPRGISRYMAACRNVTRSFKSL